ncbi:MAG: hypothetical protein P1U68_12090 [Verrucomicrobiales bacterium]|nr:hypothetical protein [Verrucomicrobiales bacterium]
MEESSSSDRNRRPRSGNSRNRNQNRSGGGQRRSGGRPRRPEPKPTGFQKFIKAITFGLVDPTKSKKKGGKPSGKRPQRRRIIEEPTTPRLYIGNLNYDLTDEELEAAFAPIGKVISAAVVRHGDSGRSKGFGFVEMTSVEDAKAAVSKLNDTELKGRQMLVSGAKAEKPRRDSGPREGGGRERRSREGGDRPPRREGRSGDRERRGGGRGGRSSDERIEKPTHQVKPAEIPVVTSTTLTVANLNKDATSEDISDLFEGIGEVRETSALSAAEGAATGELTIEFTEVEAAQKAVEVIDLKFFMGHQLRLSEVKGGSSSPAEAAPASEEEAPESEGQ